MSDKYQLKDGAILRDGVQIATRDQSSGTLTYEPGMERYRGTVTQFLREQGMDKPPVIPPEVAARMARVRTAGEDRPDQVAPIVPFRPDTPVDAPAPAVVAPPPPPPAPIATATVDGVPVPVGDPRKGEPLVDLSHLRRDPNPAEQAYARGYEDGRRSVLGFPGPAAPAVDKWTGLIAAYTQATGKTLDPFAGTKDKAFVDWMHEHRPEQAAELYEFRKTHRTN